MGKGDKKTRKGKIISGSYGKKRQRKKVKPYIAPKVAKKEVVEDIPAPAKEKATPKKAAAKKATPKKTTTKKATAKKTTTTKKTAAKKATTKAKEKE